LAAAGGESASARKIVASAHGIAPISDLRTVALLITRRHYQPVLKP
jgi:hypothetical protein